MHSYFARHEVDKKGKGWDSGSEGYPSAGLIAWLLWGGDSGKSWAERKVKALDNKDTSMRNNDNKQWFSHPSWGEGMLGKKTAPQLAAYSWIDKNLYFLNGRTAMLLADLAAGAHESNSSLSIAQAVLAAAKDMVKKGVATRELRDWAEQGGKFSRSMVARHKANSSLPSNPQSKQRFSFTPFTRWIEDHADDVNELVDSLDGPRRLYLDENSRPQQVKDTIAWLFKQAGESGISIPKWLQTAKSEIRFERTNSLSDACWDGYEAVGTKKKDGATVQNCVPMARPEYQKWVAKGYTMNQAIAIHHEMQRAQK